MKALTLLSAIWSSSTSMWAMSSKWSKPEVRRAMMPGFKGYCFVWLVNVSVIPALLVYHDWWHSDPSIIGPYSDLLGQDGVVTVLSTILSIFVLVHNEYCFLGQYWLTYWWKESSSFEASAVTCERFMAVLGCWWVSCVPERTLQVLSHWN